MRIVCDLVTVKHSTLLPSSFKTTMCNIEKMAVCDRYGDNEDGYDEMFQNESEDTDGRERKGSRPGALRCGYCVKQGNVVS